MDKEFLEELLKMVDNDTVDNLASLSDAVTNINMAQHFRRIRDKIRKHLEI